MLFNRVNGKCQNKGIYEGKLVGPVAPLVNVLLGDSLVRQLVDVTVGSSTEAPLAAFSRLDFHCDRWCAGTLRTFWGSLGSVDGTNGG